MFQYKANQGRAAKKPGGGSEEDERAQWQQEAADMLKRKCACRKGQRGEPPAGRLERC